MIRNGSDRLTKYESLTDQAAQMGLTVREKPLAGSDGRIYKNRIAIRKGMTEPEKVCVLAEEIGHHKTSTGDILDQEDESNRKQEYRARLWAYNHIIGLIGIIQAYEAGCKDRYEMADYFGVSEKYLKECLDCYKNKYGIYKIVDNYILYFYPYLRVVKIID